MRRRWGYWPGIFLLFLLILLFIGTTDTAVADVVDPEYFNKKCDPGEIEVSCSYRSVDTDWLLRNFWVFHLWSSTFQVA